MINFGLFTNSAQIKDDLEVLKLRCAEHYEESFSGMVPNALDIEGLLDDCRDIYLDIPVKFLVLPGWVEGTYDCFLMDDGVGKIENMEEIILTA